MLVCLGGFSRKGLNKGLPLNVRAGGLEGPRPSPNGFSIPDPIFACLRWGEGATGGPDPPPSKLGIRAALWSCRGLRRGFAEQRRPLALGGTAPGTPTSTSSDRVRDVGPADNRLWVGPPED